MFSHLEDALASKKKSAPPVRIASRNSSHPDSIFNLPPSKVIKADRDYKATKALELSFKKGDFFFVIGHKGPVKFEVINPITKQRGIVPKDYFELVEKSKSLPAEKRYNISEQDQEFDDQKVKSMIVHDGAHQSFIQEDLFFDSIVCNSCEWINGTFQFNIQVKSNTDRMLIIKRTYDDIWATHVSLLNHFPEESGRGESQRTIPYLDSPNKSWTPGMSSQKMTTINTYLTEWINLPRNILKSQIFKRFFHKKGSDLETSLSLDFEQNDDILDIIGDYQSEQEETLRITVMMGRQVLTWTISKDITFPEFLDDIESKMDVVVPRVDYEDETRELCPLRGEQDFQLLLRTKKDKLVFFVADH